MAVAASATLATVRQVKPADDARRFTPPSRDGVGASCIGLPVGTWLLLIDFLVQQFPAIVRDEWLQRFESGAVLDQEGSVLSSDTRYRANSKIYYYRQLQHETRIPFEASVLYQDDYLVAVDKPHFLPVTPAGRYLQQTLLVRLKNQLGIDTLAPMHRIDRETAGVVVFTIQPATRAQYQALFRQRAVRKQYQAIASFLPDLVLPLVRHSRLEEAASFMQMREVDGVPNATTRIELLAVQGALARYGLQPESGQRHQLRVQMQGLGMPILHDRIYPVHLPEPPPGVAEDFSTPLQLLAKSIEFIDPIDGRLRSFESQRQLLF